MLKEPLMMQEEMSTTGSINRMCQALNVPSRDSLDTPIMKTPVSRKRARRETE